MCGGTSIIRPHLNSAPDWVPGGAARRHPAPPGVDPQVLDDQQAAIAAGQAVAEWKRKRAASALQAGSRGLIGQASVLGAAAAPAARGTGGPGSTYGGGSILGNAAGGGR